MYVWELVQQSLRDMWAHKIRSLLALFGIVWGTAAVVLLLALGQGFYQINKKNMMAMTDSSMMVWFGKTTKAYQGLPIGRAIRLPTEEIMHWPAVIPEIHLISPLLQSRKSLKQGKQRIDGNVVGVAAAYQNMRKIDIALGGRFPSSHDVIERRQVVFLGKDLKQTLFGQANAIGQTVTIDNIPFVVVGVQHPVAVSIGGMVNNARSAFIPYTSYLALWGDTYNAMVMIATQQSVQVAAAKESLLHYLSYRYRFDPSDKSAARIYDFAKSREFFDKFFVGIQLFLGFCGLMTLIVGGIGVANILFLIVAERTSEIGLRMALGAKPKDIMWQFMLEAGLIVAIGGLLGLGFSIFIVEFLQIVPLPEWLGRPVIIPLILLATVAILATVALLAGYFPARRAAAMQPVTALGF